MKPYPAIDVLSEILLEDSYILAIAIRPAVLELVVEFRLLEGHPAWAPAEPGAAYCARRGLLRFSGVEHFEWIPSSITASYDATGEADYGEIDSLRFDGNRFELEGDIGEIKLTAGRVEVILDVSLT